MVRKKIKKNNEIIHIGYFSSDFREHPVAHLLVGVLQKHNRKNFKVYGYSIDKVSEDEFSKKIINLFDVFHNVKNMSNKEITMLARSDEIDIAIDLNGYTQYSRTEIFAYRAAPIQINYLGYPGTLGAEFIDYIVADKNLIPKKSQKFYSEKPIYLPNTHMPTDNKRKVSNKFITKSEMGLPEDSFVFCCFNNNFKITCEEFDIWMVCLVKLKMVCCGYENLMNGHRRILKKKLLKEI